MLVGLGVDIVEIERIRALLEKFGQRFILRLLTPREQELLKNINDAQFVAGRFAAKEAAAKALGTGLRNGVNFQTLQILQDQWGKPLLELLGPAREFADSLAVAACHISLTHSRDNAAAVVVLESETVPRV